MTVQFACVHCTIDDVGNHEWQCPNHPNGPNLKPPSFDARELCCTDEKHIFLYTGNASVMPKGVSCQCGKEVWKEKK